MGFLTKKETEEIDIKDLCQCKNKKCLATKTCKENGDWSCNETDCAFYKQDKLTMNEKEILNIQADQMPPLEHLSDKNRLFVLKLAVILNKDRDIKPGDVLKTADVFLAWINRESSDAKK